MRSGLYLLALVPCQLELRRPADCRKESSRHVLAAHRGRTTGKVLRVRRIGRDARRPAKPQPTTEVEVSYESDPTLARIKALGSMNVANAKAEAEATRKQALIDSGLPILVLILDLMQLLSRPLDRIPFLRAERSSKRACGAGVILTSL